MSKTREQNRRRKIAKRAEMRRDSGIQSDSQTYMWNKFDTMTYSRKVTK